jgi:hypothetical protein
MTLLVAMFASLSPSLAGGAKTNPRGGLAGATLRASVCYRMQGTHDMGTLKGLDLRVGGDWAKALYDRAIPNFLSKYAKKWGAKVGETEIDTTPSGSLRYEIVDPKGNVQDAFRNRAGADEAVKGYNEAHRGRGRWTVRDNGSTEKVHSIDITPTMKKSVLHEGQPIAENQPIPDWRQAVTGQAA